MKVIFDTNIVISAVLKNRQPEQLILFVAEHPEFEWVASPEIITEYVGVLGRKKFSLPDSILNKWTTLFYTLITVVTVQETAEFPRDPNDAKFVACALATQADYFVTGDKDFAQAYKIGTTTVLSVSQFLELICEDRK